MSSVTTPLISIIVPIYNTDLYIEECIESVLSQSYQDWELLLIDDGSTDSSYAICERYSKQDNRIKTIHKVNEGVSRTRNRGIELAQGEYIIFLDADDYWCDNDSLRTLVESAVKHSLDIIRGEFRVVDMSGNNIRQHKTSNNNLRFINSNKVISSIDFMDNIIQRDFFIPLYLIKVSIIKQLRFNENRIFLEDVEFISTLLSQPMRCMYYPIIFYAYRKHCQSISSKFTVKKLADAFDLSRFYYSHANNSTDTKLYSSFLRRSYQYYYLTLKTIGEYDTYYKARHRLTKEFDLISLRNDLRTKYRFLPILILHPQGAISYYKYLRLTKNLINKIIKKLF